MKFFEVILNFSFANRSTKNVRLMSCRDMSVLTTPPRYDMFHMLAPSYASLRECACFTSSIDEAYFVVKDDDRFYSIVSSGLESKTDDNQEIFEILLVNEHKTLDSAVLYLLAQLAVDLDAANHMNYGLNSELSLIIQK